MTPFEITITIIAVLIVLLMLIKHNSFIKEFHSIIEGIEKCEIAFCEIRNGMYDDVGKNYLADITKQLDNIKDNMLDDYRDVCSLLRVISGTLDNIHRNVCADVAEKMVDKAFPIKEGESLDAAFEPDYKLKKDIESKLNGFAAAVLDAECCTEEMIDLWSVRICTSAYKYIKQFKIDWDKLSKEQQDEFLKRLICPDYDKPFEPIPHINPTWPPCYPHRDCINCPRHGITDGTWTASTNTNIETTDNKCYE